MTSTVMTNDEIYNDFCGVIRDTWNMNKNDLDKKYEKLRTTYPKIYSMAIDSVTSGTVQESTNNLKLFLKTMDDISKKKISKENADMFIGNQMGKEYIYPITGEPSQKDYKDAIERIKKYKK